MSILAHLPILQVALPLTTAPLCALLSWRSVPWLLATVASYVAFAISLVLVQMVTGGEILSYAVGNWEAPWGIELKIDVLNAYMLVLLTGINALTVTYARRSVEREIPEEQHHLFYTAWMLCITGLLGITATGDAFNIFVFLEISSLSSYVLVGCGKDRRALVAAFKYLVMGSVGATFFLIGVGLLYMNTGTLNIQDMAARLADVGYSRAVVAASGFIILGLALKFAMFPLHLWLPNAYAFSPSAVSAFLAATSTKVSIYVLLRFEFLIFQPNLVDHAQQFGTLMLWLSIPAFIVGSVAAIYQQNLKRTLAYSSVAQVGYIILGLSFLTHLGVTAGILHIFNHALAKGALFLAAGCLFYRCGSMKIRDLHGVARQMPWTMAAFVIAGMSLIGIPLTAGFISKLYLVRAALDFGGFGAVIAALVLFSSLLAVVYIGRIIEAAYFKPRPADAAPVIEAPLALLVPTWLLVLANIYFGVATDFSAGLAGEAARQLLAGAI